MKTETLVEIYRGGIAESRHRGAIVVVDCQGDEVHVAGDLEHRVYIRSAIKPFVSALVVARGAADALGLSDGEIAIAGASHGGTDEDDQLVRALLEHAAAGEADLANPESLPSDEETKNRLVAAGEKPSRIRQMCSGEHAALLALCRHEDWPLEGYWREDHPAQQAVEGLVERLFGDASERAIDDCGLPTWHVPVVTIARAYAWLAQPQRLPERLRDLEPGFRRVRDAMLGHPTQIGGPGVIDTDLIAVDKEFVAKEGAEGLLGIGSVGTGLGIAITIEDGDITRRATAVAALATLSRLQLLDPAAERKLRETHWKPMTDPHGREVGEARAVFHMPALE
jgi:L-asparaginase II